MPKKSQSDIPEVFLSNEYPRQQIYALRKQGKIKKIASMLYTSNVDEDTDSIIHRNMWRILELLYPDAIISERTAVEMKVTSDGSLFVISDKKRSVTIGNLTIRPKKGAQPQPTDMPFMSKLYMASPARIILENAVPSRSKNGVSRGLSRKELEIYIHNIITDKGEDAINKLRDEMRKLAPQIGLQNEFESVNKLISTLLRTHDGKLESNVGTARSQGFPFDARRIELFAKLFSELEKTAPIIRSGKSSMILSFFDAYFSNFIEGTKFTIDEAEEIVFKNTIPVNRPEDAHDIKSTFDIISNESEMKKIPRSFDDFMNLLMTRHEILMGGRPDKNPGQIKQRSNQAGSVIFVKPELVSGTLKQGFEIYKKLTSPFSKAVFMMFLVAEVHPFDDGNGRIGRIMMNAELISAGEQRIIIPIIFHNNYIAALKAISHNAITNPLVRTLDFAQKYTGMINWNNFEDALEDLTKTRAFLDSNEAEDEGLRLVLPSKIIG